MTTVTQGKQTGRGVGRDDGHRDTRGDYPYTMRLPDGRTLFIEVPGSMVATDRTGEVFFTPEGARLIDRVHALAMPTDTPPRPAYIAAVRQAMGLTQTELGHKLGVDKMTVYRWERGMMKPREEHAKVLRAVVGKAKREGVTLPLEHGDYRRDTRAARKAMKEKGGVTPAEYRKQQGL